MLPPRSFRSKPDNCCRLWGWQRRCFRDQRFSNPKEFPRKHRNTPFCSSRERCKRLLLRISCFRAKVFYRFRLLLRSVLWGNEWRRVWADLPHSHRASDGNAWGSFHRFSCGRDGRGVWSAEESPNPLRLPSWHRRTYRVRSSSMPCRYGSLCLRSSWGVRHRYWWPSWMGAELPVLSHVEVAVGEPETVLYLNVHVTLALQKGNRSDPISLLHEILERGHFLLLHLRVGAVFGSWAFYFGLRNWGSRTIHAI